MKANTIFMLLAAVLLLADTALAVPSGRILEFSDNPMGKVVFDGKIHKDAGLVCKDCHKEGMFPKMKQGTVKITMEEIYAGRLCGVCHNGKRAFGTEGNCSRCHVK